MTALGNSHKAGEIISPSAAWRLALAALLGGWVVVFGVYYGTSASLVRTWVSSDLYSHGFFIIPVAGYLLWRRRSHLRAMPICPSIWGLVGIALSALTWLIGEVTATNTLAHLGLIGMLQSVFFTIFGPAISQRSLYPLGYLFLAVPFGAGLIEPLQQLTAAGTVRLIRLTGIAIHLDGFMLVIPAGRFHITEACAGVRFLLSTFALAWLAADILYASPWRRLAFLALAVVVPLAANTLRAYLILVIASVSGPSASSTFDHVTYGLVFLGFVMFLLLLIGFFFRDRGGASLAPVPEPTTGRAQASTSRLGILLALSLSIAALPALLINNAKALPAVAFKPALMAPSAAQPWKSAPDARQSWRPSVLGPDAEIRQTYLMDEARVDLYIGYFAQERQGAEAVNEETVRSTARKRRLRSRPRR